MQKIKTKISKASIYQFEKFFHLSSLNESFSSSYSDKNQLKVVANILKNDSIKAIDITHFNSPPSIIPSKYYDKSIRAKYLETIQKYQEVLKRISLVIKKLPLYIQRMKTYLKFLKMMKRKLITLIILLNYITI